MKMFTLKTVAVANDGCPAIKEAMTKSPVTVSGNETVAEALYKMNQKNVLRLPVVTESGSVAGIIAKSDIKAKQAELAEYNAELPGSCPVSKLAKSAITINENKNVADAYNMLNDEDIKSLVVHSLHLQTHSSCSTKTLPSQAVCRVWFPKAEQWFIKRK